MTGYSNEWQEIESMSTVETRDRRNVRSYVTRFLKEFVSMDARPELGHPSVKANARTTDGGQWSDSMAMADPTDAEQCLSPYEHVGLSIPVGPQMPADETVITKHYSGPSIVESTAPHPYHCC